MRSAKAELERARQAVEEARIVEAYATVSAPLSGPGHRQEGQCRRYRQPRPDAVDDVRPEPHAMIATVRESLALQLKVGQQLPARLDAFRYECQATVSEIVPEAQAESRSFQVKVTGPCPPERLQRHVRPDLHPAGGRGGPGRPRRKRCVASGSSTRSTWSKERRSVAVGGATRAALDEGLEVLSGLKEGEKVVLQKGYPEQRREAGHERAEFGSRDARVEPKQHDFLNGIVHVFLDNNFSIILIVVSVLIGLAALLVTAREEDPQIVVPLADVMVSMPGYSAAEVEQLVATPLEKILYQIDGVEYVYSMSREDQAIITVRFYVGRTASGAWSSSTRRSTRTWTSSRPAWPAGWSSRSRSTTCRSCHADAHRPRGPTATTLRRVGEEVVQRLSALPGSFAGLRRRRRAAHGAGRPRPRAASGVRPRTRWRSSTAIQGPNVTHPAGDFTRGDAVVRVEAGRRSRPPGATPRTGRRRFPEPPGFPQGRGDGAGRPRGGRPATSATAGGPARGFEAPEGFPGTVVGRTWRSEHVRTSGRRRRRHEAGGDHGHRQAEGHQRRHRGRVDPPRRRGA